MDLNKGNGMNQNTEMGNPQMNMQNTNMGMQGQQTSVDMGNMNMGNMNMGNMNMGNMNMGVPHPAPVVYNNVLDKKGALNINLMIYVLITALLFITGQTTPLVLLFLVAVAIEKNADLTKTLATFVVVFLGMYAVYSVIYVAIDPLSTLASSIVTNSTYGEFMYNIGNMLYNTLSKIKGLLSWVYDAAQIILGLLMFMNVNKGNLKTPKLLTKFM